MLRFAHRCSSVLTLVASFVLIVPSNLLVHTVEHRPTPAAFTAVPTAPNQHVSSPTRSPSPSSSPTPSPTQQPASTPSPSSEIPTPRLAFVPNRGQTDAAVHFQARGLGGALFFTPSEVVLSLPQGDSPATTQAGATANHAGDVASAEARALQVRDPVARAHKLAPPQVVRVQFDNANPNAKLVSTTQLPGVVNYLLGNDANHWRTNVPTFAGLTYQQLYAGIDLQYDGVDGQLKGTYTVAPKADPARIRWRYSGAGAPRITTTAILWLRWLQLKVRQPNQRR